MRVLIIGGDGYCGFATAMYLSKQGHDVAVLDNLIRRHWDNELDLGSLTPISSTRKRLDRWYELTGRPIPFYMGDVCDYPFLIKSLRDFGPDAIVHFGEQRSAPFSMIDREHAVMTQVNNVVGTLNLLHAMRDEFPDCHLVNWLKTCIRPLGAGLLMAISIQRTVSRMSIKPRVWPPLP